MFPNRAIIIAPIARDLSVENPHTVRIAGANNGIKQMWDTLDQDYWVGLNDATLQGYGTFAAVPFALKKYLVQVRRYDNIGATVNPAYLRLQDCVALDFIKTINGVKTGASITAADRPTEWEPMHRWLGNIAETLGGAL